MCIRDRIDTGQNGDAKTLSKGVEGSYIIKDPAAEVKAIEVIVLDATQGRGLEWYFSLILMAALVSLRCAAVVRDGFGAF